MKVVGIVAEYNPFHNGHEYHIEKAKEQSGADYCIAVMTGDFVQRGEPAIFNKYARAEMALKSGVDLVLELPVCFGTASAEYFASGAIAMLDKLGCVTDLYFGSECGNLGALTEIAKVLVNEPDEFKESLAHHLRTGKSYPFARDLALTGYFKDNPEYMHILSGPNNILAIEYIKAIIRRNSNIIPDTIRRMGSGYHDARFSPSGLGDNKNNYASAIAIRTALMSNSNLDFLKEQVPPSTLDVITKQFEKNQVPLFRNDFSLLMHYKLLTYEAIGYENFADVSRELSDRIKNNLRYYKDFDSFIELLKTKELTYARISRALLHILLEITKESYENFIERDYVSYASILGFNKNSTALLNEIKKKGILKLLPKTADANKIVSDFDMPMFNENIKCSHIYQAVLQQKGNCNLLNMFQCSPIILESLPPA